MGEPNWEDCICNWSLGMGPDINCPVHGRPELCKESEKVSKETIGGKANVVGEIEIRQAKGTNCALSNIENQPCQWSEDGKCPEKCERFTSKKAVVLVSGGMDSAVCLAMTLDQGYEVYPLTFEYGQRHVIEKKRAAMLIEHFRNAGGNIKPWKLFKLDLTQIGGSALTTDLPMPKGEQEGIPLSYVPGRNAIMLTIAMAYAEVKGCQTVVYGANHIDYSGYPDCRPDFVISMEDVAMTGFKSGAEGHPIGVWTPLIEMTKKAIVLNGMEYGVPFEKTWSCYNPKTLHADHRPHKPYSVACGVCPACTLRLKGFREANVHDPIKYAIDDGNHCPNCRSINIKFTKSDLGADGGCLDCGWSI